MIRWHWCWFTLLVGGWAFNGIGSMPVDSSINIYMNERAPGIEAFTYGGSTWASGRHTAKTSKSRHPSSQSDRIAAFVPPTSTSLTRTSTSAVHHGQSRSSTRRAKAKAKPKSTTRPQTSTKTKIQHNSQSSTISSSRETTSTASLDNSGLSFPLTSNPQPNFTKQGEFVATVFVGSNAELYHDGSCGLTNPDNTNKYPTYDRSLFAVAMPDAGMDGKPVMAATGWSNPW